MSFTFLLCVLSNFSPKLGSFFKHPATLIFSFILLITCVCVIAISKKYRREVPLNYILLAGATLGESCFLAATAADLKGHLLMFAIFGTCIAVGALFLAALKTSSSVDRDVLIRNMVWFLSFSLLIHIVTLVLVLFAFGFKDKALMMAVSCLMLIVSAVYVMYALLLIIIPGTSDKDDYIMGALLLYLEIARLFYWMMQVLKRQ